VPGVSMAVVTAEATPPPVAQTFQCIVTVKGPRDRAVAFVNTMRSHAEIQSAWVPLDLSSSSPKPQYIVFVTATRELTKAWIGQVGEQSNTEILRVSGF